MSTGRKRTIMLIGLVAVLIGIGLAGARLFSAVKRMEDAAKVDAILRSRIYGPKRAAAIQAMGERAVPRLIQRLNDKPSYWERICLQHNQIIPRWIMRRLPFSGLRTPEEAAGMLGDLGGVARSAIPQLENLYRREIADPGYSRPFALNAITKILRDAPDLESYLARGDTRRDPTALQLSQLVAIMSARDCPSKRNLIRKLMDTEEKTRDRTLFLLAYTEGVPLEVMPELWDLAQMSPHVRVLMIRLMARTDTNGVILAPRLSKLIDNQDPAARLSAAILLSESGLACPSVVPIWKNLWADLDPGIREALAHGALGTGANRMMTYLAGEDEEEFIANLPWFLLHSDTGARWAALDKLARLGPAGKPVLPALRVMVRTEENDRVLAKAIRVSNELDTDGFDLRERYRELTKHPVSYVREAAEKALADRQKRDQ